jgi:DNA invertase Pin-like site-specific DNA recombinase
MRLGYCLITDRGYDHHLQLGALKRAGCRQLFTDYDTLDAGGGRRPMLARALAQLRGGDELVIWHRDHLGLRAAQLASVLAGRGIGLSVLSEAPHLASVVAR